MLYPSPRDDAGSLGYTESMRWVVVATLTWVSLMDPSPWLDPWQVKLIDPWEAEVELVDPWSPDPEAQLGAVSADSLP